MLYACTSHVACWQVPCRVLSDTCRIAWQGGVVPSWKLRFVILDMQAFTYFADLHDQKPLGTPSTPSTVLMMVTECS